MSLLTPTSVSVEDGELGEFVVLDSQLYQDMRWCANCGGPQIFVPVYEFESGRVGFCFGCGEERIAPFTRLNSEAA
jgi:hypothetical protein